MRHRVECAGIKNLTMKAMNGNYYDVNCSTGHDDVTLICVVLSLLLATGGTTPCIH